MMERIANKPCRLAVGLMSGTSVDGIDAALVELSGSGDGPKVKLLAFQNTPYPEAVREKIFALFQPKNATVDKLGYMNFLLGEYFAAAALAVIQEAGLRRDDVDFIASHGQTIWHAPVADTADGYPIRCTVQIGEGAVIAERTGIPTVSDFRVADMATPEAVYAFDTGPGNMMIDAVITAATNGAERFDRDGAAAARGKVCEALLQMLTQDAYYTLPLPKSTGREHFGEQYTAKLLSYGQEHGLSFDDLAATATELTAWSIADAYTRYVLPQYRATELIAGGGGSYNPTLLAALTRRLGAHGVNVRTQENLGLSSDAKEAVAFALLGDRFLAGLPNVLPTVTGAQHAAVMGKLSHPTAR